MKIFLDANIILDMIDINRGRVDKTKNFIANLIENGDVLFTSCDIFTTVYFVATKKINSLSVILELEKILEFVNIIPIDILLIQKAVEITKQNSKNDLEDVLQFVCAKFANCELIVTNDKNFYTDNIKL